MERASNISLIDLSKQLPFEIDDVKKDLCFGENLIISCGHYEGNIGEESSEIDSWPCLESTASEHSEHKDKERPAVEIQNFEQEENKRRKEEPLEEDNNFHFFFFPDCLNELPPDGVSSNIVIEHGFPRLKAPKDDQEKCTCVKDSKGKCECDFKFPCKCGALTESQCNCDAKEVCICENELPKPVCTCESTTVCLCFGNIPHPTCTCNEIEKPCVCDPAKFPFPVCQCKHKPTLKDVGETYGEEFVDDEASIEEPCKCQKIEPKSRCRCMKGMDCTCSKYCICDIHKTCSCESTSSKERICGEVDSSEICNCEVPLVCNCPKDHCACYEVNICTCDNPENCKCHSICKCEKPCICDTKIPKECVCLDPAKQLEEGLLCTCGKRDRLVALDKIKKTRAGKDGYRWCHEVDPRHTFFDYGYGRYDKIECQDEAPQKVHILGLHDNKEEYDENCPLHGVKAPPPYKKKIRKPSLDCCSAVGGISINVETLGEDKDKFLVQVVSNSSKEGLKAGSKLVSIIDSNFHTMEENRTENVTKKDTTKERRNYIAIVKSGYYNKVTKICGDRTVVKRLYHSFDNARNFLLEGANIVLLRYLGLRRYKGTLKTDTVLMGGEICESIYVCHGATQAIVNGKSLFVVKVERHIIEPNGNIHQTLTVLTLRGYTVSHEWADNCYILHINPLLNVIPEKDEIEPHAPLRENWRKDLQLLSDFLDMKSARTSEGGRYMSENGTLNNVVREYLQALLLLKPSDALHFTHHYFSSALSALDLPHNEYFEPGSKRVRASDYYSESLITILRIESEEENMLSIPDIATQLVDKTLSESNQNNSSTIFLVGNKSTGKSTLLHSFLDKTDATRETMVLEYSFGRKTMQKQGFDKNVCHVWEYGGNLDMLKNVLTSVPMRGNYTFSIMLDLSKVKSIWNTLETSIKALQEAFLKSPTFPELMIIGGKYDLFKNYDSDIKKIVCNTLRSVALVYNCNLFFYSSKEPALVRRAKEVFHSIGFGTGFPAKDKVAHVNKPLYIPKSLDSWENIGISPSTIEQIKARFISLVPFDVEVPKQMGARHGPNTAATYSEPVLDSLTNVKYDELRNIASIDIPFDNYLFK